MASWNQQYGTTPSPDSSKSSLSRKRRVSGSLEPLSSSQSSLTSPTLSESDAYFYETHKGRPPSNNPPGMNEPPAFQPPHWTPAALLNPRSYQPQQRRVNNPTPQAQPQQLAFQFDSPAGSYQNPPQAQPPPQQQVNASNGFAAYANGGGMGHMLERMHNLSDRSLVPQKRQKIHDERPQGARKAEFNGGGRGGVLGEYVRKKREEGQKESMASGKAVDLSSGLHYIAATKHPELTLL